jgi:hypothetical protein
MVHSWQYLTAAQRLRFRAIVVRAFLTCQAAAAFKRFDIVPVALAGLSYELVPDEIFQFAVDHLVDAEASPLLVRCNRIVKWLLLPILEGDHFADNARYLLQIIEAAVANFGRGTGSLCKTAFAILRRIADILPIRADVGRLPDKHRPIARAFLGAFEPAIVAAIARFSALPPMSDSEGKEPADILLRSYFASFPTSFVESELTFILREIAGDHPGSDSYRLLRGFAYAHPSLIERLVAHAQKLCRTVPEP